MVAANYEQICKENRRRYGTEGALKSGELAAGLYDNRTHFIFELIQNAEDALGRRGDWHGSRKVAFTLTANSLALSHFGRPFDEADARSVCDILESTKNESSIGRFGLGFKSVYAVTDRPEIHSGDEDFAIEDYVFPKRVDHTPREVDETQIILPLKLGDLTVPPEITAGLRQLGPDTLLFLRHIDEISWSVEGGPSGFYLRNSGETLGHNVQRITVIGKESGRSEVDQNWLVFHRDVFSDDRQTVGCVQIAFLLVAARGAPGHWAVQPLASSPLVVFFPTVLETHLGFRVQGPYRTTPSRDNISPNEPWNQHLIKETASLLVEAMCWMRDQGMLGISALRCLPLDREKFPQSSRFAPMFDAVRQAFQHEAILLTFDGGYVCAGQAKLARSQELRDLFSREQVATLLGSEAAWLSGDITQDKAPDVRQYLMRELDVEEIRPEKLVPSLTKPFLEAQSEDWVLQLYEFLSGQGKSMRRHLETVPIIRLNNGSHVVACENGKANAFLPSAISTGFPTMRPAVCTTPEVREFLGLLGITEPDPVDDVIWHVLPKYQQEMIDVDDDAYAADVERIRTASGTDSTIKKEKLHTALRGTRFVMVVDAGSGKRCFAKPGDIYIATERLKRLFAGVVDVLLVDDNYDCLHGEDIRDLLVTCGASRYLAPLPIPSGLDTTERRQIRKTAGLERASWETQPEDFTIRGLKQLLKLLPTLEPADAKTRAVSLWDALSDLEGRGSTAFYGSYRWGYSHTSKTAQFDATFVRTLNQTAWVPDATRGLVPPGFVVFNSLGWKPNPFLLTKITFKPPIIDQLAKEAGIDPAAIDLLRKHGITSVADLESRLGIINPPAETELPSDVQPVANNPSDGDVYGGAKDLYGKGVPDILPGTPDPDEDNGTDSGERHGGQSRADTGSSLGDHQSPGGANGDSGACSDKGDGHHGKGSPRQTATHPFISYVGTHPDNERPDPDGLDQARRMQIEERAIDLIISLEPTLHRTPDNNPGFDLYEADSSNEPVRWVEVKSMTGSLKDRPVGLSRTQFDYAREKGDAYWLYVVEHVIDPAQARVLRIQSPAARAQTFTFDHGWSEIARTEPPSK